MDKKHSDTPTHGTMTRRQAALGVALAPLMAQNALAQGDAWPNKPIKLVVPQGPGGGADLMARILGKELSTNLKVPVLVENRPGAAAMIGSAYVAKSPPDGYTFLFGFQQIAVYNPHLYKTNAPLDPLTDLVPVSQVLTGSYVLSINNDVPARNLAELVAYVKANPGKIAYASYGAGSGHHLTTELLCQRTGMEMIHVPYKETPVMDVIAGRIQVFVEAGLAAKENIRKGNIRAIAVTADKRNPTYPDVPTLAESFPGLIVKGWQAIWAPKGTSDAVAERMAMEVRKAVQSPELRQRIADLASEPSGTTPGELKAIIAQEYKLWGEVITSRNIRVDG
jgi:tripartite-type tricarboxylate transporter receptor subunit TctC